MESWRHNRRDTVHQKVEQSRSEVGNDLYDLWISTPRILEPDMLVHKLKSTSHKEASFPIVLPQRIPIAQVSGPTTVSSRFLLPAAMSSVLTQFFMTKMRYLRQDARVMTTKQMSNSYQLKMLFYISLLKPTHILSLIRTNGGKVVAFRYDVYVEPPTKYVG